MDVSKIKLSVYEYLKTITDLVFSILAIISFLPVMLIAAIAVKLDSKGPVFYSQTRIGKNGRLFKMHKFRTMRQDAEAYSGPQWATDNDPRITSVGRFLRKARIDELPQFFNVLKLEMSIVGPRPERPFFVEKFEKELPNYQKRHLVRPGITGEAQIFNGYDANLDDVIRKVQYDLAYQMNMSFIYDIKMLYKTVAVMFTGRGAK